MKHEIKSIREALGCQAELFKNMAIAVREEDPALSYSYFVHSEVCKETAEAMERLEPKESQPEGGGRSWFYVCGECHGQIDPRDKFCRWCGHPIRWK